MTGSFDAAGLLLDDSLSHAEKVWILRQRILHISAELRAANTNRTAVQPDLVAERLREAQRMLLVVMASPGISTVAS